MKRIAGVDEAGRGPLAGPVVAAAAVFSEGYSNPLIDDSKKLSAKKRESLVALIQEEALEYAVVSIDNWTIDRLNIREATKLAMSSAVRRVSSDLVLIDGNMAIDTELPQRTIVGGDATEVEIAAASILAKVHRDRIMKTLDGMYPGYGMAKHSGYPTKQHRQAIADLGPSPVHRVTFKGVKEFV